MDVVGRLHLHQQSIDDFAETGDTNKVHKHIVFGKQIAGILMNYADKDAPAGWHLSEQQTNFKQKIPIGSNVVIVRESISTFGEGERFVVTIAMYGSVPVEQEGKRPAPYARGSFQYKAAVPDQTEEPRGRLYVLTPELAKKVARALFEEKEMNVGALADALTSPAIEEQGRPFLDAIHESGQDVMYAKQNILYFSRFGQLAPGDRIHVSTTAGNPEIRQGRAPVYFVQSTATDQNGGVIYRANLDLMTISSEQLQREITQKTA